MAAASVAPWDLHGTGSTAPPAPPTRCARFLGVFRDSQATPRVVQGAPPLKGSACMADPHSTHLRRARPPGQSESSPCCWKGDSMTLGLSESLWTSGRPLHTQAMGRRGSQQQKQVPLSSHGGAERRPAAGRSERGRASPLPLVSEP